jgi:hypothetical protein
MSMPKASGVYSVYPVSSVCSVRRTMRLKDEIASPSLFPGSQ